jgi:peptidoglycan hydrolase-like protein with peptidoglycan-binding domain
MPVVSQGSRGDIVRQLQEALAAADFDPGPIDGIYGPRTAAAVTAWKQSRGYGDTNGRVMNTDELGATAGGAPAAPAGPSDDALIEEIRRNYGFMAGFLDVPELRPILLQAARDDWDVAKLQGAIYATTWWKSIAESERVWTALKSTDPAEAERQTVVRAGELTALARDLGISISADRLKQLADHSIRYGWTSAVIQDALRAEFDYVPGAELRGAPAVTLDALQTQASQWGMPLSPQDTEKWLEDIVKGVRKEEEFGVFLKNAAKTRWSHLSDQFDDGYTPEQIFAPFRSSAANLLGKNPAEIDLSNPMWGRALEYTDPTTQKRRLMDVWEWEREIKSNAVYDWRNSPMGTAQQHEMGLQLLKMFGEIG